MEVTIKNLNLYKLIKDYILYILRIIKKLNQGFNFIFDKNNKLVFEGEYRKGAREGKGVYNYEGGEIYDGMFVNGKRDKGVFTWKDGLKWDGKPSYTL